MRTSGKNRIENFYWFTLIVAVVLALILILIFFDTGIRSLDPEPRDPGITVEERLQKLQELRASSTVSPPSREERIDRLEQLRGGN